MTRGWSWWGYLTVRITGDPGTIAPELRRAVLGVDPTQPPADIRGMDERLARSISQRRFYTALVTMFALAGLLLASAGVYGTVSYFVAQRTRELGIRIALGAAVTGIMRLVIRRGVRLSIWGVALGLLGVWGTVRVVDSLVYGVAPLDVPTIILGCVTLTVTAVVSSALPALRAVRVQPVSALRSE